MDVLEHGLGPWTFDELQALPESPWRYEIIDGGLLMTPPPGTRHERITDNVRTLLKAGSNGAYRYRVWGPIGVDIEPTYLIPDLVVICENAAVVDRDNVSPSDLALVVEVVSPGSVSTDRILKPAKYAAAGIPHYWRVETKPETSLTAYMLPASANVYTELGTWKVGETAQFGAPFHLEIAIADLER